MAFKVIFKKTENDTAKGKTNHGNGNDPISILRPVGNGEIACQRNFKDNYTQRNQKNWCQVIAVVWGLRGCFMIWFNKFEFQFIASVLRIEMSPSIFSIYRDL